MKKSTLFLLAAGALMIAALPVNAQAQATQQAKQNQAAKTATNAAVVVQTTPPTHPAAATTTPVVNPPAAQVAPVAAPVTAAVPLTCTWDVTDYDFGKNVVHLKPATATYTFTNKGKEPVTIAQVSTSCGCTAPKYTKEPIKAGEKGEVTLTYNSAVSGFFSKSAQVILNDGQKYTLTIKGEVQKVEEVKTEQK